MNQTLDRNRARGLAALLLRQFSSALLVLGVFAVAPAASAQTAATGAIEGRVQSAASGNYLTNARVRVNGTNLETFTNAYGEFRLEGVPAGPAALEVFYTGLATQK